MPNPSDRRPLKSRQNRLAQMTARWLSQRSVTPNQISQSGIAFAALAGMFFWMAGLGFSPFSTGMFLGLAALFCQMRLLANLFDGMVAVEGGKAEPDGPFWNEAPDRISDILIFVGLGFGAGVPALGWAAACLAVGTAYLRELGRANGLESDFSGPMAKPQRMAVATGASVIAAVAQSVIAVETVLQIALWIVLAGAIVTVVTRSLRVISGLRTPDPEK